VLNHFKNSFFEFAIGLFPENLGAVSEEHGERFHQDIKEIERRYQGQWNVNMMGDYCWKLHRKILETHVRGRATYTVSLATAIDNTRPMNKI
jgi:hypothetical protein